MRRPRSARAVRARSTASRMSLTPAITAESCMNSASARRAISRASVVLPVPGGPQRISECSWPFSSAWRSGLPGAQHLLLADELVEGARPHAIGERPQRIVGRRVAQEIGLPARIAGAARAHCVARRPNNQRRARASGRARAGPAARPSSAPAAVGEHVARIAVAPDVHVVLRELDARCRTAAGTRRSSTSERRGTRPAKYSGQRAMADQMADLVVPFEASSARRAPAPGRPRSRAPTSTTPSAHQKRCRFMASACR